MSRALARRLERLAREPRPERDPERLRRLALMGAPPWLRPEDEATFERPMTMEEWEAKYILQPKEEN